MGELTPASSTGFWIALDYVPLVLTLAGCYALSRTSRVADGVWSALRYAGAHRGLVVVTVGLVASLVAIALSLARTPVPLIQDEHSYLLAADTFAQGRVTNPTHPHWHHLETFHVIHEPTYMSKYPPAQGLALGLGQWLTGDAVVGVWLSTALAVAAVCWMLQGWVPSRWALLGSLLLLANVTVHITWGQTFWGGQMALLGGALVYGALPRILRGGGVPVTLVLVTGVAILANSRPYEGLVVSLPAAVALLVWFVGRDRAAMKLAVTRVVVPGCIVLAVVVMAMGYYNQRITGDPWRMAYAVHEEAYDPAPLFLWGSQRPVPEYRHASIRGAYEWMNGYFNYERRRSVAELSASRAVNALTVAKRLLSPALLLPLLAIPWALRRRHMRWVALAVGGNYVALAVATWGGLSHYYAPSLALTWLLIVQGLRHLHLASVNGRPLGRYLVLGLVAVQVVVFVAVSSAYVSRNLNYRAVAVQEPSEARPRIEDDLVSRPGKHLVMVRYDPDRELYFSWTANRADIDGADVVWAHSMDDTENRRLFDYFSDRRVWWLYHDGDDWQVSQSKEVLTTARTLH